MYNCSLMNAQASVTASARSHGLCTIVLSKVKLQLFPVSGICTNLEKPTTKRTRCGLTSSLTNDTQHLDSAGGMAQESFETLFKLHYSSGLIRKTYNTSKTLQAQQLLQTSKESPAERSPHLSRTLAAALADRCRARGRQTRRTTAPATWTAAAEQRVHNVIPAYARSTCPDHATNVRQSHEMYSLFICWPPTAGASQPPLRTVQHEINLKTRYDQKTTALLTRIHTAARPEINTSPPQTLRGGKGPVSPRDSHVSAPPSAPPPSTLPSTQPVPSAATRGRREPVRNAPSGAAVRRSGTQIRVQSGARTARVHSRQKCRAEMHARSNTPRAAAASAGAPMLPRVNSAPVGRHAARRAALRAAHIPPRRTWLINPRLCPAAAYKRAPLARRPVCSHRPLRRPCRSRVYRRVRMAQEDPAQTRLAASVRRGSACRNGTDSAVSPRRKLRRLASGSCSDLSEGCGDVVVKGAVGRRFRIVAAAANFGDCIWSPGRLVRVLVDDVAAACALNAHVGNTLPVMPFHLGQFFSCRRQPFSLEYYVNRLVSFCNCSTSAFVTARIYLDRVRECYSELAMTDFNCHRLLITGLVLAIKYLDDDVYSNAFYARVGGVAKNELNLLEASMLKFLDWRLVVSPEAYRLCADSLLQSATIPDWNQRLRR